jgi:hypothetical protein
MRGVLLCVELKPEWLNKEIRAELLFRAYEKVTFGLKYGGGKCQPEVCIVHLAWPSGVLRWRPTISSPNSTSTRTGRQINTRISNLSVVLPGSSRQSLAEILVTVLIDT